MKISTVLTNETIEFEATIREEYIERHILPIINQLYDTTPDVSRANVYIDCTYLDTEKNSCFKFLR